MPPRHGKSLIISEAFPSWYLGRNPDHYVIAASYSQDLADDFGRKVRNQLTEPWYHSYFPTCQVREDSKAARRFHTSRGGVYYAVGVGGPVTGRGAHVLIIDDPIKGREDADSEVMRRKLREWYTSVAYTRLMPGGAVILVQTRWHEDDLAGWALRENSNEGWRVLSLPAVSDAGEALWPEFYDLERLNQIRLTLGSKDWASLYQQSPIPDGGGTFQREWFKYYKVAPDKLTNVIISWDCSFKGTATSDYVVGQTWGRDGASFYLLDQVRDRMDFPATLQAVKAMAAKWRHKAIIVEDKANGPAVMQALKREVPRMIAVNPEGGKEARANAVAPMVEAGNVYLPDPTDKPWVLEYLHELTTFPSGRNDDCVDATSQALTYLGGHRGPPRGVIEAWGSLS